LEYECLLSGDDLERAVSQCGETVPELETVSASVATTSAHAKLSVGRSSFSETGGISPTCASVPPICLDALNWPS
jgi:hypothetical protein